MLPLSKFAGGMLYAKGESCEYSFIRYWLNMNCRKTLTRRWSEFLLRSGRKVVRRIDRTMKAVNLQPKSRKAQ